MGNINNRNKSKRSLKNFKRVLFYTDFSREADLAFETALEMVSCLEVNELFLLHVIPESESQFWKTYIYEIDNVDSKARQDIDKHIAEAYQSRMQDNIELKVNYRIGNPSQEIIDFAVTEMIDLIIIGKKTASRIADTFFANIAEKVVKKAPCCVFVVTLDD